MQARILALAVLVIPASASAEVGVPECQDDRDCIGSPDGPTCDGSWCTACAGPEDCPLDTVCENGACVIHCSADIDCSDAQPHCDRRTGTCTQCLADDDCIASEYCGVGWCFDDVCEPGQVYCLAHDQTITCNAAGSDFEPPVDCPVGFACMQTGRGADEECMPVAADSTGAETTTTSTPTTGTPTTSDDDDGRIPAHDSSGSSGSMASGTSGDGGETLADRGCGCTTAPSSSVPWLGAVLLVTRRRARQSAAGSNGATSSAASNRIRAQV